MPTETLNPARAAAALTFNGRTVELPIVTDSEQESALDRPSFG